MRALVFRAPFDVRCEPVPDPALEDDRDAILEIVLSGVCGSDLHVYRGRETGLDPGTVLGHEYLGVVREVGAAVTSLAPGDRVVGPFSTSCGGCFYCRRGLTSRCEEGRLFGWRRGGSGLDGAQAEGLRVPLADSTLVRAPDDLPDERLLLLGDVLPTGLFATRLAQVGPGVATVVLGAGPVGLAAVVAARRAGAEPLFSVDPVAARRASATALGAVALGPAEARDAVRRATGGRGADAVLEMVGSPAASRGAIDLLRPGGIVAAAGVHTEELFAFSPAEAYDLNLTYRAGRCPARALLDEAIELARWAGDDLAPLVSHRWPITRGPEAYRLFDERPGECCKVVLES